MRGAFFWALLACAGAAPAQESASFDMFAGDHGYTRCSFSVSTKGQSPSYELRVSVAIGVLQPAKGLVMLDQPQAQVAAQRVTIAAGAESLLDIELARQATAYLAEMDGAAASALIRKLMQHKAITVGVGNAGDKHEFKMTDTQYAKRNEQLSACLQSVVADSLENRIDYAPR